MSGRAASGRKVRKTGPAALEGTDEARRLTFLLLESLSGILGPSEAAEAMGVALPRYYQLETRALQAMIDALEPRPRGRRPDLERELKEAHARAERLARDLKRYQALNRASQRALGLPSTNARDRRESRKTKTVRRRRKRSRGERVAAALKGEARSTGGGAGAEGEGP